MNKKLIYTLLTILIATILVYVNSISNGYNMDDSLVMTNNNLIDFGNFKSIFTQYSYQSSEYNFAYRPLCIFSFYLENLLFGKSPQVSHIVSLILYIIVNFTLFFLLYKVSNNLFSSLIITLLFISFPLHTEVVDNIKNRDELFVSIAGFLALYFTICSIISYKRYHVLLIFIFSLLGILFKESFIVFPLVIACTSLLYHIKSNFYKRVKVFLFYLAISGGALLVNIIIKLYFLDKTTVIREFEFFENPLFFSTISERILPSIYIIGYYISLLLNPFKLSYYYGYNTVNFTDYLSLNFTLGVLFIISIPIIILYQYKNNKLLIIGILILTINLLAISNFVKPLVGIVAERFLFNGSLGFCIIIYYLLLFISNYFRNVKFRNPFILICSFLLVIPFTIKTITRNRDWKDEFTLYSHDIKNVPNSAKANEMLADNYYKKYFIDNSITNLNLSDKYYHKTIEIYPEHSACLNNLGTINYIKKEYQNAIEYYQKTLSIKEKPLIHYNLAQCYNSLNEISLAKKEYEIALLENPDIPNLFSNYKSFIISNNLVLESIDFMENSMLSKHNNKLDSYLLLIDLYNELKDYKMMLKYLKIANKINPSPDYLQYINQLENYLENN